MGIHDRDYYREGSSRFLDSWGQHGVTVWLIGATCAVFFAQALTGKPDPASSPLVGFGRYDPDLVMSGEVWRLLTPVFLHANLWHLFVNMLILYFTGVRHEARYGRNEFLAFYLTAGVFAQSFYLAAGLIGIAPENPSVGASGATVASLILYAFHYPRQQVLLFLVIPMPVWALAVLYVALDALGALGLRDDHIAFFVHLGGALFGAAYHQTGIRLVGWLDQGARTAGARVRPRLRVIPADPEEDTPTPVGAAVESPPRPKEARDSKEPVDEQFEKRVDQVLEKVSKHGKESLTPEEREILFKASELYKKRRK